MLLFVPQVRFFTKGLSFLLYSTARLFLMMIISTLKWIQANLKSFLADYLDNIPKDICFKAINTITPIH